MHASQHFKSVAVAGRNLSPEGLETAGCSENVLKYAKYLPLGEQVYYGIPFDCGDGFVYVSGGTQTLSFAPFSAKWIMFLHSAELFPQPKGDDGLVKSVRGNPPLNDHVCDYVIKYADGETVTVPMRSRMEINDMRPGWGMSAMLAVPHQRARAFRTASEERSSGLRESTGWGASQYRVGPPGEFTQLQHWIYAFENPRPDKEVTGMDVVRKDGNVYIFGVSAGDVAEHPLRYGRRQKAVLTLTAGDPRDPYSFVDIDMGHIISVLPKLDYDHAAWEQPPKHKPTQDISTVAEGNTQYVVEYDAHGDAVLYSGGERLIAARDIPKNAEIYIAPAERPVTVRVCDKGGKPVPVRIHAHGVAGEYLPPRNHHRVPNGFWLEDFSPDFIRGNHFSAYIDGTEDFLLPVGEVYFEIFKGFEVKPLRRRVEITSDTDELTFTLDRVLDWRSKGWVTADTHVHFISPHTALLEGEAEGVNVVNLLATQWGELFTNVADFTGKDEVSNGEYMVRVGTENRQHIMGHISLLGYDGRMILPLTTGGPDESALGDPMEITLTQWAERCKKQNGLVVMPHFPGPRAEYASAIVSGFVDGVEMVGNYTISPYYLSDWYRFLNCGYRVAAIGGTDKMSSQTNIGCMRTYALVDGPFSYETWKQACRAGKTFVTSGPLVDMRVEGNPMGSEMKLNGGAKLTVSWDIASATIPVTAVELVVNGDTADGARFDGLLGERSGVFTVDVKSSAWIALRVRGKIGDAPEVVTAHTSAVFAIVKNVPLFNGPDAATILDQIEGATAYVKTLATKAQEREYKAALSALAGAHRALHNRMHASGHFHNHTVEDKHEGH